MKISKNLLAGLVMTTVAAGSVIGVSAVSAQENSNGRDELVTKLAEKFNVDVSEVESVFEEQHTAREAEMATKRDEHLQSLVDAGTITSDQKTALQTKFEEMKNARDALKDQDLTRAEMHTKMEEGRTALKAWAKEQGIDLDAIRPEGGMGGGPGHGFRD